MKKLLICLTASLALIPSIYAQSDSTSRKNDKLSEIEALEIPDSKSRKNKVKQRELFDYEILTYYGYGLNLTKSDDFTPHALRCYDIFFNALELQFNPGEHFGINLGATLEWKAFASNTEMFTLDADKNFITITPEEAGGPFDRYESYMKVFSINVPLCLEYRSGLFDLRVGAELDFNLSGRSVSNYKLDNHKGRDIYKKAVLNKTSYALVAAASFSSTGIYVKYYPAKSPLTASPSPEFSFVSLGIILSL